MSSSSSSAASSPRSPPEPPRRSRDDDGDGRRAASRDRSRSPVDRRAVERRDERDSRRESRRDDRDSRRDERDSRRDELDSRRDDRDRRDDAKTSESKSAKPASTAASGLATRTGGAYIPPARLKMMQQQISDKSSTEYQRMSWNALKKSINGFINKVNVSNIQNLVIELFQENLVRGRGLFARASMKAQTTSPTFTHVYAALVAIINTKFPQLGELIVKRLILQFRKTFRRNDKQNCINTTKFLAHLVNQQVAHEIVALEILTLLLERPTNDSVEVGIAFLKEVGQYLTDVSPRGLHAIFERLRAILHEGQLEKRVQYMIEVMFAVRKDGFKDFPAIPEGLDLVEEQDQITHMINLDEQIDPETKLDVFKHDPDYLENEEKYKEIKAEILGSSSSEDEGDGDEEEESSDEEGEDEDDKKTDEQMKIVDMTETNLVALRRTIYLTIMSSLDYEETAHKLLKMTIKPGQETELCNMIIECCSQERSYLKFYGLLAQRFCELNVEYQNTFAESFRENYATVHRLSSAKLRQVARLFAHLFFTDAIPWTAMECIRLNERDTTSSSRIFIKELFLELMQFMGLAKLLERLKDPFLQASFAGIFPKDNPKDTRFSINFFTTIGLGALTEDMREHLKNAPKALMTQKADESSSSDSDSDSDSSSGSSGSSGSDSGSSSSGSESDTEESPSEDDEPRRRRRSSRSRDRLRSPPGERPRSAPTRRDDRDQDGDERREDRPTSRDPRRQGDDSRDRDRRRAGEDADRRRSRDDRADRDRQRLPRSRERDSGRARHEDREMRPSHSRQRSPGRNDRRSPDDRRRRDERSRRSSRRDSPPPRRPSDRSRSRDRRRRRTPSSSSSSGSTPPRRDSRRRSPSADRDVKRRKRSSSPRD